MNYDIVAVNYRTYPKEFSIMGQDVKVVLVRGTCGKVKAYQGCGSDQFVAGMGNKVSYEEALIHFPFIEKEEYRKH